MNAAATTPSLPGPEGRDITVVLADDSDRFRAGMVRALGRAGGIRVLAAVGDGREALEAARVLLPDVLVVDDRMPGLSGPEVAERVTSSTRMLGVRVVMLSANEDPELVVRARQAGAVASIDKAMARSAIVSAIRNAAG